MTILARRSHLLAQSSFLVLAALAASPAHSQQVEVVTHDTICYWNPHNDAPTLQESDFTHVGGGDGFSVAIRAGGLLASWGQSFPQIFSSIPPGGGFVDAAGGGGHALALSGSGGLFSWGYEFFGGTAISGTPAGLGYTAVEAAGNTSFALRADGSIAAWGESDNGTVTSAPSGTGHTRVSASLHVAHALRADGSIASWGSDAFGQVTGTPSGSGFLDVAAGDGHSIALRADGSLVSWGIDAYGQVSSTPTGTGFVQVSAGSSHSVALRSSGGIETWGEVYAFSCSPWLLGIASPSSSDFVQIASGPQHLVALRSPDCNGNGVADYTDLAGGVASDCNGNFIPDSCDLASGYSTDVDGDGQLDDCVAPPLHANTYEISVAAGGTQVMTLTAGPGLFLDRYLMVGSLAGTSPGTPLGALTLPLNLDGYSLHTILNINQAPLSTSFGYLTTSQPSSSSFTLPPAFDPVLVGMTVHHAFLTLDGVNLAVLDVSNPIALDLIP